MILLIGGTSDSLFLMDRLCESGENVLLSVATQYGAQFSERFSDRVVKGRMDKNQMVEFIQGKNIAIIIDASHPFADLVSENAIEASRICNIPYYRFERPSQEYPGYVRNMKSIEEVCDYVSRTPGRVYLTTGSKTLKEYALNLPIQSLHIRVLPTAEVLTACEEIGFTADQIDAIKGPFSTKLNYFLFKKANCQYMITKESGMAGGLMEKILAAHQNEMEVLLIKRPEVKYPKKFTDMNKLIEEIFKV